MSTSYHTFNLSGNPSCRLCHTTHSSIGKSLIKKFDYTILDKNLDFTLKIPEKFCLSCHISKDIMNRIFSDISLFNSINDSAKIFLKERTGSHILYDIEEKEINCSTCHDVHKNIFPYAMKISVQEMCIKCHNKNEYMFTDHYGAECNDCHKIHKKDFIDEDKKCTECHEIMVHELRENCKSCHKIHREER